MSKSCGYQGHEFGAEYLDSLCVDGILHDADDCDDEGRLYEPTEKIPCPVCRPKAATRYWAEQFEDQGHTAANRMAQSFVSKCQERHERKAKP